MQNELFNIVSSNLCKINNISVQSQKITDSNNFLLTIGLGLQSVKNDDNDSSESTSPKTPPAPSSPKTPPAHLPLPPAHLPLPPAHLPPAPHGTSGSQSSYGIICIDNDSDSEGSTGPRGSTGSRGSTGPTGAQGSTGPRGPTGYGLQGPTGPPGSASGTQSILTSCSPPTNATNGTMYFNTSNNRFYIYSNGWKSVVFY